jgi:hypothetical protein
MSFDYWIGAANWSGICYMLSSFAGAQIFQSRTEPILPDPWRRLRRQAEAGNAQVMTSPTASRVKPDCE